MKDDNVNMNATFTSFCWLNSIRSGYLSKNLQMNAMKNKYHHLSQSLPLRNPVPKQSTSDRPYAWICQQLGHRKTTFSQVFVLMPIQEFFRHSFQDLSNCDRDTFLCSSSSPISKIFQKHHDEFLVFCRIPHCLFIVYGCPKVTFSSSLQKQSSFKHFLYEVIAPFTFPDGQ